jgi:nitrogen fixation NifU-like protein
VLEDLYRDIILDHYRHPQGAEPIPSPDRRADGQNPLCGDECSISVASGSMMAGEIKGRSLAEVMALEAAVKAMLQGKGKDGALDLGDLEALEGVAKFPVRVKCALLPWSTLLEALSKSNGGAP